MNFQIENLTHLFAFALLAALATSSTQAGTRIIVQSGDPAPDGNGFLNSFGYHAINNSGQVAFFGFLSGTSDGFRDDSGVFRDDGTTLTQFVRAGQEAPDGNGRILDPNFKDGPPALNDAGQVAVFGFLTGTTGGSLDSVGIFRGDDTTLTQIARRNPFSSNGGDTLLSLDPSVVLNNSGQVAFHGDLRKTSGEIGIVRGIFIGDGTTQAPIVLSGQVFPGGNLDIPNSNTFDNPRLNDAGQVSFYGFFTGPSGGGRGIFRSEGATLTEIVRSEQTAPDGNGTFSISNPAFDLKETGEVAFTDRLSPICSQVFLQASFVATARR